MFKNSTIGERLHVLRGLKKQKLDEWAQLSGVSSSTISRVEHGHSMTVENLFKLFNAVITDREDRLFILFGEGGWE